MRCGARGSDVFKVIAKTNLASLYEGKIERTAKRLESHLRKYRISSKVAEWGDFKITAIGMFLRKRGAKIDDQAGVYLTGDCEQSMEGMSPV